MGQDKTEEADFADFVREFAHGSVDRAARERLRDVIAACTETGTKGSLTLKFTVEVKAGIAQIGAAITCKKPEAGLPGAHYYTDAEGGLHDEDPRQQKLPLKTIATPPTNLRTIDIGNTKE